MKYRKKPIVIDAVPYTPGSGLEDGWVVDGVFYHRGPLAPPTLTTAVSTAPIHAPLVDSQRSRPKKGT